MIAADEGCVIVARQNSYGSEVRKSRPTPVGREAIDIFNHPLISQRYFFPRRQPLPGAFVVSCPGADLACYHHAPHPGARTLVHFHGNGEIVADYLGQESHAFSGLGLNVFFAEFRGYGASGGLPQLGFMLEDVPRIIASLGLEPSRIILFGRSVGSIFAIRAAACYPKVAGMIIESGIAEPIRRLLLRVQPEELGIGHDEFQLAAEQELGHRRILAEFRQPLLVLHTRHDGLVDVDNGQRIHEWAAGPKRLRIFERGNHNSIMAENGPEYLAAIQSFADGLGSRDL